MALFLTGGGDQENFRELDRYFLNLLPMGSRVIVVPNAADDDCYDEVLERVESCFDSHNIADIEMVENIADITPEKLVDFNAVFIEGGNTFKLIKAVRQTSFSKHILAFWEMGHHIYADSAGAIILGADIKTAFLGDEADEDHAKLQDYRGLGLLGSFSVHCHYQYEEAESLGDLIFETGHPILALSELTGIVIEGDKMRIFGKEPLEVFSFTGRKIFLPGTEVQMKDL